MGHVFAGAQEYMRFKMKGADPDLSKATYRIEDEDHTLGNALRWMLMKKFVRGHIDHS
jgi:DNA-directed RNA polymerase subunit L